jgi:hypothetical protein
MIGPSISFVASLDWIAIGEHSLNPLWHHGEIFFKLHLNSVLQVHAMYEQWQWGSLKYLAPFKYAI